MAHTQAPTPAVERTIDSLERIYAVVIALAISQAITSAVIDDTGRLMLSSANRGAIPFLLIFLFTVVPFYHGMNRHLDVCYLENAAKAPQQLLLLEFVVFFIEAGLLFAFAASVRSGLEGLVFLGVLLAVDTAWGVISAAIHRTVTTATKTWATINFVTVVLCVFLYTTTYWPIDVKSWLFSLIAFARSALDYWTSRHFYFPRAESS